MCAFRGKTRLHAGEGVREVLLTIANSLVLATENVTVERWWRIRGGLIE